MHGLMDYDWMVSAKERPWHGIGTVVEDAPTSDEAIKLAKLDWDVVQVPVMANGVEIPNYFCNMRDDMNLPLGIVKGRYKIVQNNEAFDFVDNIIGNDEIECHYETAESLFNGKKIFLLVKLPNKNILGDDIENYLFFTNSHDGSSALTAGLTNVRVVCNNTLQMALKGAQRTWYCRHTESITNKKQQAQEALGLAVKYIDTMEEAAEKMAQQKINEEKFFRRLFEADYIKGQCEKNKELIIERIHTIYNEKDDLQNFKGTAWGLYQATCDYVSNAKPFRQTETYKENKLNKFFVGDPIIMSAQKILMAA